MDRLLAYLLTISLIAGVMILAIILLRALFNKLPRWIFVMLWCVVGLRLIVPITIQSDFSFIPSRFAEYLSWSSIYDARGEGLAAEYGIFSEADAQKVQVQETLIQETLGQETQDFVSEGDRITVSSGMVSKTADKNYNILGLRISKQGMSIIVGIWIFGILAMLIYTCRAYHMVRSRVAEAVKLEKNVFQSERIISPFILGMCCPRIYVPYGLSEDELRLVLAHEKSHIRQLHHFIKPIAFAILSIYWFNPLLWVAYILLCSDIEIACDECVLGNLGVEVGKSYSKTLLNCSVNRKVIAACPLAFGEVNVKMRIKKILKYKKASFVSVVAGAMLIMCFMTGCLTNPKTMDAENSEETTVEMVAASESTEEITTQMQSEEVTTQAKAEEITSEYIKVAVNGDNTEHEHVYVTNVERDDNKRVITVKLAGEDVEDGEGETIVYTIYGDSGDDIVEDIISGDYLKVGSPENVYLCEECAKSVIKISSDEQAGKVYIFKDSAGGEHRIEFEE